MARRLRDNLTEAGFAVDVAGDGEEAADLGKTHDYAAVVLDLGLPLLPGPEVLKRWRAAGLVFPVLILTARTGWVERVAGLNAGADDYLEKPFQPQELIARLRALIRRSAGSANPTLRHGDIEFDPDAATVTKAGGKVDLTAVEMRVLAYFLHRPGRIISQSDLLDHVYTAGEARNPNTAEAYVARLRKKLGHDLIRTVRGLGYRLE